MPLSERDTGSRSPQDPGCGDHRGADEEPAAADGHLRRRRASHGLIEYLDQLAARPGHQLTYSIGWDLGERERTAIRQVPAEAWQNAIDAAGAVRERRADDSCGDLSCAHVRCWLEEAHVTELTGLLREGPGGDELAGWPAAMRVFARRERPHPGAQLTLSGEADGWRYSLHVTNLPAALRDWRAQLAYIDAAHRAYARVEDRIRTGKTPESAASHLIRWRSTPRG